MTKNGEFSGIASKRRPGNRASRAFFSRDRDTLSPKREGRTLARAALIALSVCAAGCNEEPVDPAATAPAPVIMVHQGTGDPAALSPCDGTAGATWIREFRDRVVSHGEFATFASRRFGEPTACHGAVTSVFDGLEFGTLRLRYPGGVDLTVETMPLETSITTLHLPDGFASDDEALALLRRYSTQVGLELDWSRPQTMTVDGRTTTVYQHPDPGLNASGRMVSDGGAVRSVGFSLAL